MCWWEVLRSGTNRPITPSPSKMSAGNLIRNKVSQQQQGFNLGTMLSCSGPAHAAPPTRPRPHSFCARSRNKGQTVCPSRTEPGRTQTRPSTHWHSRCSLCFSLVGDNKQSFFRWVAEFTEKTGIRGVPQLPSPGQTAAFRSCWAGWRTPAPRPWW